MQIVSLSDLAVAGESKYDDQKNVEFLFTSWRGRHLTCTKLFA